MTRTHPGAIELAVVMFVAATTTCLLVVTVLRGFSPDTAAIALTLDIAISLTTVGVRDLV